MTNQDIPKGPVARLAGKHYWVSDEYSVPADNLCWNNERVPARDYYCVRDLNHLGWCNFVYSPLISDCSWMDVLKLRQVRKCRSMTNEPVAATPNSAGDA